MSASGTGIVCCFASAEDTLRRTGHERPGARRDRSETRALERGGEPPYSVAAAPPPWYGHVVTSGDRLKKLARGVSAEKAAAAYARRSGGAALSDADRADDDQLEATLEAMFLMAAVDGQVATDEIAQLAGSMQAIVDTEGAARAPLDVDALLVRLGTDLERDGWTARLGAVAARLASDDARAFAFRLAAAVAFIDDHVAHAEAAAIHAFAAAFDLDDETSQEILLDVRETLFEG